MFSVNIKGMRMNFWDAITNVKDEMVVTYLIDLRDRYAELAARAVLSAAGKTEATVISDKEIAVCAYAFADAMLNARGADLGEGAYDQRTSSLHNPAAGVWDERNWWAGRNVAQAPSVAYK